MAIQAALPISAGRGQCLDYSVKVQLDKNAETLGRTAVWFNERANRYKP